MADDDDPPAARFTMVSNTVARDKNLSCRAKGLFLNMASHKPGFPITEEFLAGQCADGVAAVRSALLELREAGYVRRSEQRRRYPPGTRNAKGKDISGALGPYEYTVTDRREEAAVNRAAHAERMHEIRAGQDNLSGAQVAPTCDDAEMVGDREVSSLPASTEGSGDQAKQVFPQVITTCENQPLVSASL